MSSQSYGVFRRRPDYYIRRRLKPITILAPPAVSSALRAVRPPVHIARGFDYRRRLLKPSGAQLPTPVSGVLAYVKTLPLVYWQLPDFVRTKTPTKPSAVTTPPAGPILRSVKARMPYKRDVDYLVHVRRIKPITITAPIRTTVLRLTSRAFIGLEVYRRPTDYLRRVWWARSVSTPTPIIVTAHLRLFDLDDRVRLFDLDDKIRLFDVD